MAWLLRLREVKGLVQNHTAARWALNPGVWLQSQFWSLSIARYFLVSFFLFSNYLLRFQNNHNGCCRHSFSWFCNASFSFSLFSVGFPGVQCFLNAQTWNALVHTLLLGCPALSGWGECGRKKGRKAEELQQPFQLWFSVSTSECCVTLWVPSSQSPLSWRIPAGFHSPFKISMDLCAPDHFGFSALGLTNGTISFS